MDRVVAGGGGGGKRRRRGSRRRGGRIRRGGLLAFLPFWGHLYAGDAPQETEEEVAGRCEAIEGLGFMARWRMKKRANQGTRI